ncbi:hypothetical protein [Conchiformibius steedae]|uniref:Uncharacterized protein n=1 Tax=Conchiformibius steedae TaxID=153493 RepID=A0A3P2A4D2_9NEIS|nr:hypothetical protein [Conchiformibius steedae]RRD89756.1 hypothetical protein EII21_07780 [Conchiformibius steedae]
MEDRTEFLNTLQEQIDILQAAQPADAEFVIHHQLIDFIRQQGQQTGKTEFAELLVVFVESMDYLYPHGLSNKEWMMCSPTYHDIVRHYFYHPEEQQSFRDILDAIDEKLQEFRQSYEKLRCHHEKLSAFLRDEKKGFYQLRQLFHGYSREICYLYTLLGHEDSPLPPELRFTALRETITVYVPDEYLWASFAPQADGACPLRDEQNFHEFIKWLVSVFAEAAKRRTSKWSQWHGFEPQGAGYAFAKFVADKDKRLLQEPLFSLLIQNIEALQSVYLHLWTTLKGYNVQLASMLVGQLEKNHQKRGLNQAEYDLIKTYLLPDGDGWEPFRSYEMPIKTYATLVYKLRHLLQEFEAQQAEAAGTANEYWLENLTHPVTGAMSIRDEWNNKLREETFFSGKQINRQFQRLTNTEKLLWIPFWRLVNQPTAGKKPTGKWLKNAEAVWQSGVNHVFQDSFVQWVDWLVEENPQSWNPYREIKWGNILQFAMVFLPTDDKMVIDKMALLAKLFYGKIFNKGALSTALGNMVLDHLRLSGEYAQQKLRALYQETQYSTAKNAIKRCLL